MLPWLCRPSVAGEGLAAMLRLRGLHDLLALLPQRGLASLAPACSTAASLAWSEERLPGHEHAQASTSTHCSHRWSSSFDSIHRIEHEVHRSVRPLGRSMATAAAAHAADPVPAAAEAAPGSGGEQVLSVAEYRRLHNMQVEDEAGGEPPAPVRTFDEAGFPPQLLQAVRSLGFDKPTVIQSQAWPIATAGRDLIAIASTGSGKTAGYVVPALEHIRTAMRRLVEGGAAAPRSAPPVVLVLAPTRELARQIQEEAMRFGRLLGLRSACLYGGAGKSMQAQDLLRHPHLVIGTPGRTLDFAEAGDLDLSKVSYLVLDEADRMLDMGFEPQLLSISRYIPRARQTLFFSATWPSEVQKVAERFASNRPVRLFVGNVSERPVVPTTITQTIQVVQSLNDKLTALVDYLKDKPMDARIIVFVAKKSRCAWLEHMLSPSADTGYGVHRRIVSLNGDMPQVTRDRNMNLFKSGRVQMLVATDVAARGLDISNVTHVVNFDAPNDVDTYVHRIGRTGRAGASGQALTLLSNEDGGVAKGIVSAMREAGQTPSEELLEFVRSNPGSSGGSGGGFRRGGGGGYGRGGGGYGRSGGDSWGSSGRGSYGRDRPNHLSHNQGSGDRWGRGDGGAPHRDVEGRTRMGGEWGSGPRRSGSWSHGHRDGHHRDARGDSNF